MQVQRLLRGQGPSDPDDMMRQMVEMPSSGEEVLVGDGEFKRVSDPRSPKGDKAEAGWQPQLLEAMAKSIEGGDEQVMIVFSRLGCPWCDRFLPVLQRAIENHAKTIASSDAATAAAEGILPLRVFVFYAHEFPGVMQQFRIEGFPTALVFGKPGVAPRLAPGFKDDDDLEQLLRTVALAKPEPAAAGADEGETPKAAKGRRLLR